MKIVRFALSTSLACLALTGCVANMGDGAGRSTANLSFWVQGDLVEVVQHGEAFDLEVQRKGAAIATATVRPGQIATVVRSDGHKVALNVRGSALEFLARSVHDAATRKVHVQRADAALNGVAGSQASILVWGADNSGDFGDNDDGAYAGAGPSGSVHCVDIDIASDDGNCVTHIQECSDAVGAGCTSSDRACMDGTMTAETECSET